jgi:hypothetical protein
MLPSTHLPTYPTVGQYRKPLLGWQQCPGAPHAARLQAGELVRLRAPRQVHVLQLLRWAAPQLAAHGSGRSQDPKDGNRSRSNTGDCVSASSLLRLRAQAVHCLIQSSSAFLAGSSAGVAVHACSAGQTAACKQGGPVRECRPATGGWCRPDLVVIQDILQHLCARASLRLALSIPDTAVCSWPQPDRCQPAGAVSSPLPATRCVPGSLLRWHNTPRSTSTSARRRRACLTLATRAARRVSTLLSRRTASRPCRDTLRPRLSSSGFTRLCARAALG